MNTLPDWLPLPEWEGYVEMRRKMRKVMTTRAVALRIAELDQMRIGRNRMFKRMKEDKILMASRMPYQKYIDKGYFSVIEQTPYTNSKGETHTTFTTMVTGAGQVFLARRYADMIGIAK